MQATWARSVDFGAVGSVDTARVTIGNTGTGVLRLNSVQVLSPTDDLSVDVDAELPLAMAAGDTVDAVIRFAPRQGRAALDAALLLYSSDPLSPAVAVPVDGGASGVGLELLPTVGHLTLVARSVGTMTITDVTDHAESQRSTHPGTTTHLASYRGRIRRRCDRRRREQQLRRLRQRRRLRCGRGLSPWCWLRANAAPHLARATTERCGHR
jgi:hypothetical protein